MPWRDCWNSGLLLAYGSTLEGVYYRQKVYNYLGLSTVSVRTGFRFGGSTFITYKKKRFYFILPCEQLVPLVLPKGETTASIHLIFHRACANYVTSQGMHLFWIYFHLVNTT